jgi:hypothetical protein
VSGSRSASAGRAAALAVAALQLAGCAALAPQPPAFDGLQPPATAQNGQGSTIPYRGTVSWDQATVLARSSRDLAVLAFGEERDGGGSCGPALLRLLVRETGSAVHLLVAAYELPTDPSVQCGPLSGIPTAHVVRLARPLGARAVVDAGTGARAAVLDGSTVPTLATDLTGWRQGPLERDPDRDLVTRTWTTGSGRATATLRLVLGPEEAFEPGIGGEASGRPGEPPVASGSIAGRPVQVRGHAGRTGYDAYLRVGWTAGPGRGAALSVAGTAPLPWTPARLVDAARTVTTPARSG